MPNLAVPASDAARGGHGQSPQALLPGQVRTAQQPLLTSDLAVLQLLLAQGVEELRRAPALGLSLLCECTPVAAKAGQLELFQQQRQRCFSRRCARRLGGDGHRRPEGVGG